MFRGSGQRRCLDFLYSPVYGGEKINDSGKYSDSAKRVWFELNHADSWLVATAKAEKHKIITFEVKRGASQKGQGLY